MFAVENGKETVRLAKLLALPAALGLHLRLDRGPAEGVQPAALPER
ncbi:MAG: hypothetical protein ACT4QF_19770 [Sporichthyaceae bacterium]